MRGPSPVSRRISVFKRFGAAPLLAAVAALLLAALSSGCASVSAENSSLASAKIRVVPSAIDFKEVVVGQKNSQTIKISNVGSEDLTFSSVKIAGAGFSLASGSSTLRISTGADATLTVAYTPSSASSSTGSIVLAGSQLKAPVVITLAGTGEKGTPGLGASPTSVSFSNKPVSSTSSQTVALTNTGNVPVAVGSVSLSNPAFSVTGLSAGVSLAPNQKVEFQVWYHPSSSGSSSGTVTISSPSVSNPVKLAVAGTANAQTNPNPPPPSAPADHSVTLDWNASPSAIVGYNVYRGDSSGGPYSRVNAAVVLGTNFKDSGVEAGTRYFYVVTAVDSKGDESAYSNQVSAQVPN